MACTAVVGSWNGRVGQRSLGDVDEHPEPVGDVLVQGAFEAEGDARRDCGVVEAGTASHHPDERAPAGTNSPSAGTSSSAHPPRAPGRPGSWPIAVRTPDRWASRCVGIGSVRGLLLVGIDLVQQAAGVAADELDQADTPEGLTDVVDVQDENDDARRDQHERHDDRETGHCRRPSNVDLAQREHGVDEGGHEESDGELAGLVMQKRLHDRGENWPIASWTTTIVMVSTSAARLTIDSATVTRIDTSSLLVRQSTVRGGDTS